MLKAICTQQDLRFALEVVSKAVSGNATLPVLENIHIKTDSKKLHFTATNLEIAIHASIDVSVKGEGAITIPARLFSSYVSLLTEGEVELRQEEGYTLDIKTDKSQTKIKGISADEFPVIPRVEKENNFEIPTATLHTLIESTVFSAAVSSTRPVLSGVYITGDKDVLKFVATDSYRLAEKKFTLKTKLTKPVECIVPVRTLLEVSRILGLKFKDAAVQINVSKNQILFAIDSVELTSRLIEGKFPDYEKIIPKASKTKARAVTGALTMATKRVSLFAKENNNSIRLAVTNDGKMQITTDETRVGEEKAEIDIQMEGDNNKVALNSQYLIDVLTHLGEKDVSIEMGEKLTPIVVKPVKADDYVYIIMPLKV